MTEPKWMQLARSLEGMREIAGARDNPEIVRMFAEAGHAWVQDDETAWCAAFVGAMLVRAGIPGSGKLDARSYLKWGVPLEAPVPGCIAVFWRGDPNGWQGHVGFLVRESGGKVMVLGGNQGNAVTIASYPKSRLLGYRWPAAASVPASGASLTVAEVRRLQAQLRDLGYHEVGRVDGSWGPKTRAAVLAFRADHDLPTTGDVDDEVWAALARAERRPVGDARATATAEDLKGSRIVANTDKIEKLAAGTIVAAGAGGAAETSGALDEAPAADAPGVLDQAPGILDRAQEVADRGWALQGLVGALQDLASFALAHWWIAVAGGAILAIWWARKAKNARVEDHRSGKTA